ncbi:MAG: transcriptional repressor LexA [Clostridia bacterium]|nr:transcriptional repressor LexA [Clostridia bacterium]
MKKIDEKIQKVYEYIEQFLTDNGYPPSVREIQTKLSIKSTATVYDYIERLKMRGLLTKSPTKNRAIGLAKRIDKFDAVPIVGTVTAGQPILAIENIEGYCPLPDEFSSDDRFMLKVIGDSMINAGIYNGDKIIVKKQSVADDGDIIVALIDDSATVKRFYKKNGKVVLHPENDTMSDMIFDDIIVLGKVEGLIRKF